MKILMTGNDGYIGAVMAQYLKREGHKVHGWDTNYFYGCLFGPEPKYVPQEIRDIRDIRPEHLEGYDAVIHLAALSNDQMGDIKESLTMQINGEASINLAKSAKEAGVKRFLFASSCSIYGTGNGDDMIDEKFPLAPITTYAKAKVMAEQGIIPLADENFTPVILRNATAYGFSPKLRLDLIVNGMTVGAMLNRRIDIVGGGSAWRPLVHVEDISHAFCLALEAPAENVSGQAINVGVGWENYRVKSVATIVKAIVPFSDTRDIDPDKPDIRNYRVNFDKIYNVFPNYKPRWNVWTGVEQLYGSYQQWGLKRKAAEGSAYIRLKRLHSLMEMGELDNDLRWRSRYERLF